MTGLSKTVLVVCLLEYWVVGEFLLLFCLRGLRGEPSEIVVNLLRLWVFIELLLSFSIGVEPCLPSDVSAVLSWPREGQKV
jgi:hypothetical protein